ncbi:PREDICTED: CMP-N-acetylneuraminate-beta-galactosamide-alpha-2,3-sialyltransferase 2-like [Chrysochloris asiatica]|uniref:Gal-NAc6S n=1 Tax=Chrysochloris asiatica TaxID=185453 RepID=A0A9B0X256_CHRAS|nr:PREDICTED: CMP-N-acetylneuraminate-beta-galactosamide-alpha-2,3-sialyltransferase 2-like [Chrysochloris asiatica]
MRRWWQIFVLWVFCVLILWLVVPCLDLTPKSVPQEELMHLVTWCYSCPWFKFRKDACSSGTLNCSPCHQIAGESNWFDASYKRTVEFLKGAKESVSSDAVLWWLDLSSESKLRHMWRKLLTVIPRQLGSHFALYCRTCVVMGSSQIVWGSNHSISQYARMKQASAQGFEKDVGNRTTGCINYPRNTDHQDSRSQLLLLLLKLSDLAWPPDTLSEEVVVWEHRNSWYGGLQGKQEIELKNRKQQAPPTKGASCRTCAVVGNSRFLQGSGYGFKINQHDMVLRFQIAQFPDGNKNKILMISLTFLKYIQEIWLKNQAKSPSLGFVAVSYALHTCDQVSLFGFGTDNLKKWSRYWNNTYWSTNTMNNPQVERNVILRLHCEGKIVMYT